MKNIEDLKKQLGITNEQMYQITAFHQKGHSVANISKSTGIDKDKIREFLIARDKKPIDTVSAYKYTITVKKSQAQRALDITQKTLRDIYEYMNEAEQRAFDLGEAFGRICSAIEEVEE